ncbi:MAG: hypothetical protein JO166_10925 [Deltaproteobacteria bacterium]|nr:hypothetical protein [Deltaproteobacteria bacterium]
MMAVKFPSLDYFTALKNQMSAEQARFRRLGFIDTTFGISVAHNGTARNFVLAFEVFELKDVHEVGELDLAGLDFAIEGDIAVWREMIENITRHGEADTAHDLNTLAHFGEALKINYADPEGHDKLYRFMESIQEFLDLSSKIEVAF